jgi:hypothetical protein
MERLQHTLKTQEEQHHAPMDKAQNKLTGMLEDYGKITGLSFFPRRENDDDSLRLDICSMVVSWNGRWSCIIEYAHCLILRRTLQIPFRLHWKLLRIFVHCRSPMSPTRIPCSGTYQHRRGFRYMSSQQQAIPAHPSPSHTSLMLLRPPSLNRPSRRPCIISHARIPMTSHRLLRRSQARLRTGSPLSQKDRQRRVLYRNRPTQVGLAKMRVFLSCWSNIGLRMFEQSI